MIITNFKQNIRLILFLSFGAILICQSQTVEDKIDTLLQQEYPLDGTGATALVVKNNNPIYSKAFGMANLELEVPMQIDMIFEIASITKQFTAVAILMLMEEDKLNLKDDITKFIPDYPTQGHNITIHHLLTHTSGIKSYTEMDTLTQIWRNDYTPKQLINVFKNKPMDFDPGTQYHYNDSGYIILGHIIEKITGLTYKQFIEKRIFSRLEMTNSYYADHSKIIKNRASGYQKNSGFKNAPYLNESLPYAAGSLLSTVKDIYKWNRAIKNNSLISEENKQLAFTNYKLNNGKEINYGYGWEINTIMNKKSIAHSGGILGFVTNVIYIPKEDLYVAVFSNCECKNPVGISEKITELVLNEL